MATSFNQWASDNGVSIQEEEQQQLPQQKSPDLLGGLTGLLQNTGAGIVKDIGSSIGTVGNAFGSGISYIADEIGGGRAKRNKEIEDELKKSAQAKIAAVRPGLDPGGEKKERLQRQSTASENIARRLQESQKEDTERVKRDNDPLKVAGAGGSLLLDVAGAGAGGQILKGGLRQAISRGAKQGALFGGAQGALDPLEDKGMGTSLEDIGGSGLVGAGTGALFGGVTGGVLKGGEKILKNRSVITGEPPSTKGEGSPSTFMQRLGKRATENGSGLKADPTVGGVSKLDDQVQFMSRYTGTPRQQRVAMEQDMTRLSKDVDGILAKNPTPIQGSEVRTQVQQAIDDPLKYADVDLSLPGVQRSLDAHLTKFEKTTSAKELNDYIKQLNPIAKRAQDKIQRGVALTDKEAAALTAKRAGDEVLSAIPEIKPLKKDMAQIFEITPQVAKAGEKKIGLPFATGIDAKSPVQAAKGVQSKLGALLQGPGARSKKVDQEALSTAFNPPEQTGLNINVPSGTASSVLGSLVTPSVARSATSTEQVQPGIDEATPEELEARVTGSPVPSPADGSIFNEENVQALVLQDLANNQGKNVNTLLALYKAFGEGSGGKKKPLSAEASKTVGNANSGLKSLSQLEGVINRQGGVSAGTLVPGRELLGGAGAALLGTGEYDTAARNIKDVITRLRTGAALTAQEEAFYEAQIPQAFDSPEVRAQKLGLFRDLFESVASQTGGSGTDQQQLIEGLTL